MDKNNYMPRQKPEPSEYDDAAISLANHFDKEYQEGKHIQPIRGNILIPDESAYPSLTFFGNGHGGESITVSSISPYVVSFKQPELCFTHDGEELPISKLIAQSKEASLLKAQMDSLQQQFNFASRINIEREMEDDKLNELKARAREILQETAYVLDDMEGMSAIKQARFIKEEVLKENRRQMVLKSSELHERLERIKRANAPKISSGIGWTITTIILIILSAIAAVFIL